MAEGYFDLPAEDRVRILAMAEQDTGQPAAHHEKDVWVMWCLEILCGIFGKFLVLKGGTSLTKAFQALIKRFSEDLDMACIIPLIAPEIFGDDRDANFSRLELEKELPNLARERLKSWVAETLAPFLKKELAKVEPMGKIETMNNIFYIYYPSLTSAAGYIQPAVKLEFSPCASSEQSRPIPVHCELAPYAGNLVLPDVTP